MKQNLAKLPAPLCTLLGLVLIMGFALPANAGAQSASPFAGTWIWNAKKSQFTNLRLSIDDLGNNSYTLDNHEGQLMKVVADGNPQTQSDGGTYALEQQAAGSWASTYKGAISDSGVYKLSADRQSTWADGGVEDRETE